jgi:hypothetical protein
MTTPRKHQILDQVAEKSSSMASHPYLRAAGDGTYELLVPLGRGFVHILPYCFHTERDATIWVATRKGREQIQQVRQKIGKPSASAVAIPVAA